MKKIDYSAAMVFALERHGQQDHGCLKIGDHLKDVVEHVQKHYDEAINCYSLEEVVAAAWLHDVLEDTDTLKQEIDERFGYAVSGIVYYLTDKEGKNRMERHLRTYHLIRRSTDATLIKLCDRRHNQARSIKNGERYIGMYLKEYTYFKFALWEPNEFVKLWEELDQQYEEMNRKMSW